MNQTNTLQNLRQKEAQLIKAIAEITILIRNKGVTSFGKIILSLVMKAYSFEFFSQRLIELMTALKNTINQNISQIKVSQNEGMDFELLFQLHFTMALILDSSKNSDARYHYQCAIKYKPYNPLIYIYYSFFLFENREIKQAIKYFQKINIESATKTEYRENILIIITLKLTQIGSVYRNQANNISDGISLKQFYKKASQLGVEIYKAAIREDKNNQLFYICLARFLIQLNRREEALQWMEVLQEINTQQQIIIALVGLLFSQL